MSATPHLAGVRVALVLGPSAGGIGSHARALRDALLHAGAAPTVVAPADVLDRFGFGAEGRVYDAHRPAGASGLRALLRDVDLVHAHGLRPATTTALALRRVPFVATWHNAVLGGRAQRLRARPAERCVARRACVSLCVSPDLVAHVFRLGGTPRFAPVGAPPPVPSGRPPDDVRSEVGADDRALIVCVARLHRQKGLDVLVDAAARLTGHPRRPLVVIAGDGPEQSALATQIAGAGAPVRLLGARSDVADLLAAADLAVLPSRWEGSPLAAHEAMAAGVPLVATATGGIPVLAAGAARLVPPEDPVALAAALGDLLSDPVAATDLGLRARDRARTWPDARASADAVLAVYAEVMAPR